MKLRNKKTGEIVNAIFYAPIGQYEITVWDDENYLDPSCHNGRLGVYKSIAELNEEWEDYTPAEPLIKDEKIRKAVRVWADTYGIVAVRHIVLSVDKTKHSVFETGYGSDYSAITLETELDLVDGDTYTIDELCGEGVE